MPLILSMANGGSGELVPHLCKIGDLEAEFRPPPSVWATVPLGLPFRGPIHIIQDARPNVCFLELLDFILFGKTISVASEKFKLVAGHPLRK